MQGNDLTENHDSNEQEDLADEDATLGEFSEIASGTDSLATRNQRKRSKERRKQVSGGRVALLISAFIPGLAGLFFLAIWLLSRVDLLLIAAAGNLLIAALYIGLYVWARKDPVKGLQAGHRLVFLFLAFEIGLLFTGPSLTVLSGIVIRATTLGLLLKGLHAAKLRQAARERAARSA